MADKTAIEWTDATWNPVTGCTKVSPGCDHCYAETFAERWRGTPGHHFEQGFDLTLRPERLDQPLRWKMPRRIFVNSMSDLFHDDIPDEYIAKVFAVMALAPRHTFQVLTKRHGRMRAVLNEPDFKVSVALAALEFADAVLSAAWPLPNVWLGVSVENQKWANIRIPALLETPAAVRWLSCEPLLGPVDLSHSLPRGFERQQGGYWLYTKDTDLHGNGKKWMSGQAISWVVVGGESGPGARPMHPAWAQALRHQCNAAGVPFLFKQWGEWSPVRPMLTQRGGVAYLGPNGETYDPRNPPAMDTSWSTLYRVGKKRAGRVLDGRTWDEYPDGAR